LLRYFLMLTAVIAVSASADPASVRLDDALQRLQQNQMLHQQQQRHPDLQLEWNNQTPQQRQALDNFYQNLRSLQMQQSMDSSQRQQQLEQLRGMSSQQRLQHFQNFVQDRGVPAPR